MKILPMIICLQMVMGQCSSATINNAAWAETSTAANALLYSLRSFAAVERTITPFVSSIAGCGSFTYTFSATRVGSSPAAVTIQNYFAVASSETTISLGASASVPATEAGTYDVVVSASLTDYPAVASASFTFRILVSDGVASSESAVKCIDSIVPRLNEEFSAF